MSAAVGSGRNYRVEDGDWVRKTINTSLNTKLTNWEGHKMPLGEQLD